MSDAAKPNRISHRIWMAAAWLFLCSWFFGVACWKAPVYAQLYRDVGVDPIPVPTVHVLAVCHFIRSFWYLFAAVAAVPLVLIACGTLDGKTGPFIVIVILGLFVVMSLASLYLFIPLEKVKQKVHELQRN